MTSACFPVPLVNNADVTINANNDTATYRCLTGFFMTGAARVQCQDGQWAPLPTCVVIKEDVNLYNTI
ncbi:complement factor H, partial [Biomphalaria pfeifferi]